MNHANTVDSRLHKSHMSQGLFFVFFYLETNIVTLP